VSTPLDSRPNHVPWRREGAAAGNRTLPTWRVLQTGSSGALAAFGACSALSGAGRGPSAPPPGVRRRPARPFFVSWRSLSRSLLTRARPLHAQFQAASHR